MTRVLLFLVLSFAVCFGQHVNVYRVSDEFVKRALTYEAPKLEPNVVYGDFFKNLGKIIQGLINEVVFELLRQIRFQSAMLSNNAISVADELQLELDDTNDTVANPYINTILDKLNTRLDEYLLLNPGYRMTPREKLADIPNPGRVWSFVSYHPMKQLFTFLESTLDLHLENINVLIDTFYKRGWEAGRYSLQELQDEFREVYLNGYLLHTYNSVVLSVYQKVTMIRHHVQPETWKKFETNAYRVRTLFEQIKPSNETFAKRLEIFGG